MKFVVVGLFLSLFIVLVLSSIIENGHTPTIGFYLAIFFIPAVIISILNGVILYILKSSKLSIKNKRIISLIPVLILALICFTDQPLPFFDAKAAFVGLFGSISIGLTNLYWNYVLSGELRKSKNQVTNVLDDKNYD